MLRARASRRSRLVASLVAALALLLLPACSDDDGGSGATAAECPETRAPEAEALKETVDTPSGGERTYFVWTPDGYDGTKPVPVVMDFHGTGGEALRYSTRFSGMVRDAPARGYMVVAPQSSTDVWSVDGYTTKGDDLELVRAMLDELTATYCVDLRRIYLSGFSLGGGFSNYAPCNLDVFAATAPFGGVNFYGPCPDGPAVPTVTWHGLIDPIIGYGVDESTEADPQKPGETYVGEVAPVMDAWAERNGCTRTRVDERPNDRVLHRTYEGCPAGKEVELYVVSDAGHTYPGGPLLDPAEAERRGGYSDAIDAAKVTLDFFDAHVRDEPATWEPVVTATAG